jgi:hypothetical protein
MGHFGYMLGLATAISTGLAIYDRKTARERVYRGAYLFGSFLSAILCVGWLMYWINP